MKTTTRLVIEEQTAFLGLTMKDLAAEAGIAENTLYNFLADETVSLHYFQAIARALDLYPSDLMEMIETTRSGGMIRRIA